MYFQTSRKVVDSVDTAPYDLYPYVNQDNLNEIIEQTSL
jgi:hypothetical protein